MVSIRSSIATLVCLLVVPASVFAADWPQWRGPDHNGHSRESGLPIRWSADTVDWKTDLPGDGQSSPTIFGDRIFLTSAVDSGSQRVVIGIDRHSGRILWQKTAWSGDPEPSHKMNGWASSTCATDGQRLYAFFGHAGGLHCFTLDGDHLWTKDLGAFVGPWGTAASPLLVDNLVIQNCDADQNAYLVALDKSTGREVWRATRDDHRGWSSPILIEVDGQRQIVLNGHTGVRAYVPETGEELWFCKSFNGRGSPTVTPANGLLHVVNGLRGDTYAIRPGGSGNVTDTHMAWHAPRKSGRDLPSPIVVDGQVLIMSMRGGILTSYDAQDGRELWVQRVGDNFSASPIAYNGRAFFISESGETFVVDPDADEPIVAQNTLDPADDEIFRAAITPSDGRVYIRSTRALYAVGNAD